MTITAIYENGVFRPLTEVNLPEKCKVAIEKISVVPADSTESRPLLRLLKVLEQYPGNPERPTDFAEQHDHYLYGTPKRQ